MKCFCESISRRDFLRKTLVAGGSTLPYLLGGFPVKAFGRSPVLEALLQADNADRILVLVQLAGGNDGLNTMIPFEDDAYYNARQTLAIAKHEIVRLSDLTGMHPSLQPLMPLFGDGRMAVVQGVGYPNPNLSHFRATDIWLTGSDADQIISTGWLGRYLSHEFPDYPEVLPESPLAVQIGSVLSEALLGPEGGLGIALRDPESFYELISGESEGSDDPVPETPAGFELSYVRQVARESMQYAEQVKLAADRATNLVDYPTGNRLADQLKVAARLIAGGLGSRIYVVQLGGFDTHAGQLNVHAALLREVADAVVAFLADIEAHQMSDKVAMMTFSEFGRRVRENGSAGTDHGTSAPMMFFGRKVNGGLLGENPDLGDLDEAGNLRFQYDFRQIYATVLRQWFGVPADIVENVLFREFAPVDLFSGAPTGVPGNGEPPARYGLEQNYPNPFNPATRITYTLPQSARVRLVVYNELGRRVATLVDERQAAGRYTLRFDGANLPSGTYVYQLQAGEFRERRRMVLVR